MDVMVIEDSGPDRLRFRGLLDRRGISFCFAWDGKNKRVPDLQETLELIDYVRPRLLLLDLAWTKEDDILLNKLLFKDKQEIETAKSSINKNDGGIQNWISGIRLIENFCSMAGDSSPDSKNNQLAIAITTQYIPPVAYGLQQYIVERYSPIKEKKINLIGIMHKWRDETMLINLLNSLIIDQ